MSKPARAWHSVRILPGPRGQGQVEGVIRKSSRGTRVACGLGSTDLKENEDETGRDIGQSFRPRVTGGDALRREMLEQGPGAGLQAAPIRGERQAAVPLQSPSASTRGLDFILRAWRPEDTFAQSSGTIRSALKRQTHSLTNMLGELSGVSSILQMGKL